VLTVAAASFGSLGESQPSAFLALRWAWLESYNHFQLRAKTRGRRSKGNKWASKARGCDRDGFYNLMLKLP
jgi:hypothetical protein